jgi:hypothetical protein
MSAAGVPLEHVADVLGHDSTRMAALVYRHVLAPTVEAGAAPMQFVAHRRRRGAQPRHWLP